MKLQHFTIETNSWSAFRTTAWIDGTTHSTCGTCTPLGPHTNNNAKGWHSKIHKLGGKAEQTATEVSLMQLAAGGLPVRRRKYEGMKRDYEAVNYTLIELVKAFSNWVSF